jgi:hypothetical protein
MGIGIEEKEEDDAEGHEVHVDAEEDTAVVEAPTRLHATNCVDGAGDGGQGREDEQWGGTVVGEVRQQESYTKTGQNEDGAAYQGSMMRIEDGMFHEVGLALKDKCVVGLVPVCRGVVAVGGRDESGFLIVRQSAIAIGGRAG